MEATLSMTKNDRNRKIVTQEEYNYWMRFHQQIDQLRSASQELERVADSLDRADCLKARAASRKLAIEGKKVHEVSYQQFMATYSRYFRQ
jgi:hypothetical protein